MNKNQNFNYYREVGILITEMRIRALFRSNQKTFYYLWLTREFQGLPEGSSEGPERKEPAWYLRGAL